jgi:hypothetical protein
LHEHISEEALVFTFINKEKLAKNYDECINEQKEKPVISFVNIIFAGRAVA